MSCGAKSHKTGISATLVGSGGWYKLDKAEWWHQPVGQGMQSTAQKVLVTKFVGARFVYRDTAPNLDLEPSNFS